MKRSRRLFSVMMMGAGVAAVACSDYGTTLPALAPPAVYFVLNAPLCSSRIPMQFSIDGTVVGIDTFVVNLTPSHTTSHAYVTTAGTHVLSGVGVNGGWIF